jgi:hypothetical protein
LLTPGDLRAFIPRIERRVNPYDPFEVLRVADFSKWKPAYDAHLPARQKAGLKEEHLLRNTDDPNKVILLFEAVDLQKAKEFAGSSIYAKQCRMPE